MSRRIPFLLSFLLLLSCSQPDSYEHFVKAADAPGGVYTFELDLSDSLCSYDFSFYLRNDRTSFWMPAEDGYMLLDITWTAPSGQSWPERVYLRKGDERGRVELYRKDCVPAEWGVWTLRVTPRDADKAFRGLGIICKKNGTR